MFFKQWICSGAVGLAWLVGFPGAAAAAQPYGLTTRPALGPFLDDVFPETAPAISTNWSIVPAFPNLAFTNALGFTHVPGTNLNCVWEREGRVCFFPTNADTTEKWLVLDLSYQCQGWDDSGLLNLAFHPGFATNRYLFVYYTWVAPGTLTAAGTTTTNTEVVFVDQTGNDTWHWQRGLSRRWDVC